jgi:hypothetical protein
MTTNVEKSVDAYITNRQTILSNIFTEIIKFYCYQLNKISEENDIHKCINTYNCEFLKDNQLINQIESCGFTCLNTLDVRSLSGLSNLHGFDINRFIEENTRLNDNERIPTFNLIKISKSLIQYVNDKPTLETAFNSIGKNYENCKVYKAVDADFYYLLIIYDYLNKFIDNETACDLNNYKKQETNSVNNNSLWFTNQQNKVNSIIDSNESQQNKIEQLYDMIINLLETAAFIKETTKTIPTIEDIKNTIQTEINKALNKKTWFWFLKKKIKAY